MLGLLRRSSAPKRRVLPHRHTGMVLGAGAQFRCTTCGEWCWQPKDTTRIIRDLEFEFLLCRPPRSRAVHRTKEEFVAAEAARFAEDSRRSHAMAIAMADRLSQLYPEDARRHAREILELRDWETWQAKNLLRRGEAVADIEMSDPQFAVAFGIASPVAGR